MAPPKKWIKTLQKGMIKTRFIMGKRSGTADEICDDVWHYYEHSLNLPSTQADERALILTSSPKSFKQVSKG